MRHISPCYRYCRRGVSTAIRRDGWEAARNRAGLGQAQRPLLSVSGRVAGSSASMQRQRLSLSVAIRSGSYARVQAGCVVSAAMSLAPKKVVFLGTPDVASVVLKDLIDASKASQECSTSTPWEISAVVTQPGRPKGRGKVPQPSPVYRTALEHGIPETRIFCPVKASEKDFLSSMEALMPDVCITAAYGNYLPTTFLKIPVHGTLNIHPSLLPLYRGAAPVQRSLQDGVVRSGVTVLYTVKEMDAGPIVCQTEFDVDDNVTSPELLDVLFRLGTKTLVESCLPRVWDGSIDAITREQDHDMATHAGKIGREEGLLSFQRAKVDHDKTRAFCGWPGTYGRFLMVGEDGKEEAVEIKVLETRVRPGGGVDGAERGEPMVSVWDEPGEVRRAVLDKGANAMVVRCADGSVLELKRLQNPGKKPVDGKAFANGLGGRKMYWMGEAT